MKTKNSKNEQKSPDKQKSEEYEQDYEIEEMILNKSRNIFQSTDNEENVFTSNNGNKPNTDGDTSLSTIATEYKTLGEDFQLKVCMICNIYLEIFFLLKIYFKHIIFILYSDPRI